MSSNFPKKAPFRKIFCEIFRFLTILTYRMSSIQGVFSTCEVFLHHYFQKTRNLINLFTNIETIYILLFLNGFLLIGLDQHDFSLPNPISIFHTSYDIPTLISSIFLSSHLLPHQWIEDNSHIPKWYKYLSNNSPPSFL